MRTKKGATMKRMFAVASLPAVLAPRVLTAVLILFVLNVEAQAEDWRYFGVTATAKGEQGIAFYDAGAVEQLPDGNVKVQAKVFTDRLKFKQVEGKSTTMDSVAGQILKGYIPPYCIVDSKHCKDYNTIIDIIGYEETADDPYLQPRFRISYEIDCGKKKIRTLSTILNKKDSVPSSHEPSPWEFISPETNAETLCKIVCMPKR